MAEVQSMSAQDALWLTMDRPNNLMVIDGVMLLRGHPDWDDLLKVIQERVVDRFAVFRCRAIPSVNRGGLTAPATIGEVGWAWQTDPDFDIARHARRVPLPEPAGIAQLEEYVGEQRARPLDRERPLWEVTLVESVTLEDGTQGSAVVCRFHHAIADGVRMTQVMLSLCDTDDAQVSAMVARQSGGKSPWSIASGVAGAVTAAVIDGARVTAQATAHLLRDGAEAMEAGFDMGRHLIRHPGHLIDAFDALGVDNRLANTTGSVAKLALRGTSVRTVWSGTPGMRKAVAWSAPLSLNDVKTVGRAHGASVNDVLLTAVAGGMRRYLHAHDDRSVAEVEWMVPVNLVPIAEMPEDLGNFFALVMAVLPLEPADPVERLSATRSRMNRIKNSDEPVLTFGIQRGISAAPTVLSVALTNFFANKAVGVLTNVPGPRAPLYLAGVEVSQVVGFAPCSGDQPMTATIFSYAGTVTVGFAVDADLVPDPRQLVDGTVAEFHDLVRRSA
ncbi:MAG: wax ester/triacylglycerol synthase family O-acyltransferase [Candidatus Nanopelagicales bacterium]